MAAGRRHVNTDEWFDNSVPKFEEFMTIVRTDNVESIKAYCASSRYAPRFHSTDSYTAMHQAIKEARPEAIVEALLDLGSDPGFAETFSGVTPFQRATIVMKKPKTLGVYSTKLLLKMLQAPSSLDFSRKRKFNVTILF
jgi:hypothetical protein